MGEYVNSRQVQFDRSKVSCGVLEAHHLPDQSPRKTLYDVANALYHKANPRPVCHVIFSDVVKKDSRGEALADFITENSKSVGELFTTTKRVNPRTGNIIILWVFTPDHEKFRVWYTEETMHRLGDE